MSNCVRCGFPLEEGDQFCKKCGAITGIPPVKQKLESQSGEGNFQQVTQPQTNPANDFNDFGKNIVEPANQKFSENYNSEETKKVNTENPDPKKQNNGSNNGKNNKILIVITGMLVVILIGLSILVATIVINEKKDDDDEEIKTENEIVQNKTENKVENKVENKIENKTNTNNKNNTISKEDSDSETITFEGFELEIPEGIVYQRDSVNNTLLVSNEEEEWIGAITVVEGVTFKDFEENMDQIDELLATSGITVSNKKTVTYSGIKFISIEGYFDTMNIHINLCEADQNHIFEIDIYEEYNYEALKEIAKILDGAKYTGESSSDDEDDEAENKGHNIEMPTNIDMKKVHEALKNM